MSIEFDKNKNQILLVYNDVLDDKSSTDWALFGYEGQTNVIKVVGYGDEGLEELTEELNASKIMYGVLKLLDPNTSRFKIILLNWQGEAAPNLRKGVCARHLHDVKRFFKGFHITFNARTEEDVDQEMILKAVTKATSTEYNFKDRSEMPEKSIPVKSLAKQFWSGDICGAMGTNYKRTNPVAEIDANRRNKFWEEQEAEEKVRKEEEIRKKEEEARNLEKERIERELHDSKQREELNKERNARILAEKKMEMAAMEMMRKKDAISWEREILHQRREEEDRSQRADHMRRERKKEAESVIGQKTHHARSIFESHGTDSLVGSSLVSSRSSEDTTCHVSRPPPRRLKEFSLTNVDQELSVSTSKEYITPKKSVGARWPPPSVEEIPPETQAKVPPGKISEWAPLTADSLKSSERASGFEPKVIDPTPHVQTAVSTPFHRTELSETSYPDSKSRSPTISATQNFFTSPPEGTLPSSPLVQESPSSYMPQSVLSPPSKSLATLITENGDAHGWHPNDVGQDRSSLAHPPANEVIENVSPSLYSPQDHVPAVTSPELEELDSYGSVCMTYEVEGIEYQILPEHGICARALYDYQAADDTEITFDPGDIITNIDQIDVGWWQGVSVMGVFGLFPANYVELINGTKIH